MEIKSALASKINWAQAISVVAMIAAMFGLDISKEMLTDVLEGIIAANAVVTIIMRTWFTTKLTAGSVR